MYIEGEGRFPYNTTLGEKKKKIPEAHQIGNKALFNNPYIITSCCLQESALLHVVVTTTKREWSDFKIKVQLMVADLPFGGVLNIGIEITEHSPAEPPPFLHQTAFS